MFKKIKFFTPLLLLFSFSPLIFSVSVSAAANFENDLIRLALFNLGVGRDLGSDIIIASSIGANNETLFSITKGESRLDNISRAKINSLLSSLVDDVANDRPVITSDSASRPSSLGYNQSELSIEQFRNNIETALNDISSPPPADNDASESPSRQIKESRDPGPDESSSQRRSSILSGPIVTCQDDCNFCHLIQTGDNLIRFLTEFAFIITILIFAVASFKMMTSGGNSSAFSSSYTMMRNAIIGVIILLSAWTLVHTVLTFLAGDRIYQGNFQDWLWNEIPCDPADYEMRSSDDSDFIGTNNPEPENKPESEPDKLASNPSGLPTAAECSNLSLLAEKYGYPASRAQNLYVEDPKITDLKNCIERELKKIPLSSSNVYNVLVDTEKIYTYGGKKDSICNITRGHSVCGVSCQHGVNSCHYGGLYGQAGSLAIDYNSKGSESDLARYLKQVLPRCGIHSLKTVSGRDVVHEETSHTHINHPTCN